MDTPFVSPWTALPQCKTSFWEEDLKCSCKAGFVKDDTRSARREVIMGYLGNVYETQMCVEPLVGECYFCEHDSINIQPGGYYKENCEKCTCTKNITSGEYYFDCEPSDGPTCINRTTSTAGHIASTTLHPTSSFSTSRESFLPSVILDALNRDMMFFALLLLLSWR
nr:uncharacterized protein LOC129273998 [Lytechinus pictus]